VALARIEAQEGRLARRYAQQAAAIPGLRVWGPAFDAGPHSPTVAVTVEGVRPTEAARYLGNQGVLVGDGHFYAARAVEVLGLSEGGGVIRAGLSVYTTEGDVDRLLEGLTELARR
jgi:selenocysteine lyase/cysteine desulfurase